MVSFPAASTRRELYVAFAIFALCLILRCPHLSQSLWYDEMTTLAEYVLQPWQKVLAPHGGEYVPNNHVLHTILAKLVYTVGTRGEDPLPPREALLRMPSLIAGSLVPIALAWPLRRREPRLALVVAIIAAVNPWLVAFSVEARGYSLMLLLGIISTNLLPDGRKRWPIGYAIALAAAVYTVPLAGMLIPAHAVALLERVWGWKRGKSRTPSYADTPTLPGSQTPTPSDLHTPTLPHSHTPTRPYSHTLLLALALITFLYAPTAAGLISYYHHPFHATLSYREFWDALPRFVLAGERVPRRTDPGLHLPDSTMDAVYWAVPMLAIVIGSLLAWSRHAVRPLLVTMGTATLLGVLLPLVVPGATEVRFDPWIIPWFCIAAASLLLAARGRFAKIVAASGFVALIGWQIRADINLLPSQPIREAIQRADEITPPGRDIIVLYLGAREAIALYGDQATRHHLVPAPDTASFVREMDRRAGHLPWVLIFYERLARDRDFGDGEARGLWSELIGNYRPVLPRLPGRVSPAAVYATKPLTE